jgi:hypothetical protein
MHATERTDARLCDANSVLVALDSGAAARAVGDFFGSVVTAHDLSAAPFDFAGKTVYLCGDAARAGRALDAAARVFVVRELASGDTARDNWARVGLGRVPVRVHGLGAYYRRFFDAGTDHFARVRAEHTFQTLTESTKPGTAHRTGIYLTPVERAGDELLFRLLRCSTNLHGPTDNFRATDRNIVDALNAEADCIFRNHAPLNHVLAQVYHNTPAAAERKQAKARISAHADKTKDMPANGVMAFCTFYDRPERLRPLAADPFDCGHNGVSGLTRLHFRRKESVPDCDLPAQFELTLYPDSVFFMPLSTNRLYTHEIRASVLDAGALPTRLGYVVRCSNAEAVYANGQTFLTRTGNRVALVPPTREGTAELRALYAAENKTADVIEYGDKFAFSLNAGDYLAPRI